MEEGCVGGTIVRMETSILDDPGLCPTRPKWQAPNWLLTVLVGLLLGAVGFFVGNRIGHESGWMTGYDAGNEVGWKAGNGNP